MWIGMGKGGREYVGVDGWVEAGVGMKRVHVNKKDECGWKEVDMNEG